ncbi:hypothetical protein B0O99DRAFT_597753 [Bisporella sp. PMI_857]|nr:hypothetical protein B0O99DRAFT_597753 [Bisporella sp. PMI_857]
MAARGAAFAQNQNLLPDLFAPGFEENIFFSQQDHGLIGPHYHIYDAPVFDNVFGNSIGANPATTLNLSGQVVFDGNTRHIGQLHQYHAPAVNTHQESSSAENPMEFGSPNVIQHGVLTNDFKFSSLNNGSAIPSDLASIFDPPSSTNPQIQPIQAGPVVGHRYHCLWLGCTSSFARAADRKRHIRTQHDNPAHYHCPIVGCDKVRGRWKGYHRLDKLQEHMRKRHAGIKN